MSRAEEIAAFVKATQGGLSTETLAKAIRRRWPDATPAELRLALGIESGDDAPKQMAAETPND